MLNGENIKVFRDHWLKFENQFAVGQRVRAYDFPPISDRPDRYIEGTIIRDRQTNQDGARGYMVLCERDTLGGSLTRVGEFVFVPFEVFYTEHDDRITLIDS